MHYIRRDIKELFRFQSEKLFDMSNIVVAERRTMDLHEHTSIIQRVPYGSKLLETNLSSSLLLRSVANGGAKVVSDTKISILAFEAPGMR